MSSKSRRGPPRAADLIDHQPLLVPEMVMSAKRNQGPLHRVTGKGRTAKNDTLYYITVCGRALVTATPTIVADDLSRHGCCPGCGSREQFEAVQEAHRQFVAQRNANQEAARLAREAEDFGRLQAQLLLAESDLGDAGLREEHIQRGETAIHIVVGGRRYLVTPDPS